MTAEPPATSFRLVATTRRCRAHQHDRVLAGVKARRFAPPGCAHGPRRSCPTARERSDTRASGTLEERRTAPMEETDRRRCCAPTSRSTSPKSPIHIPGIGDPLHRNTHWSMVPRLGGAPTEAGDAHAVRAVRLLVDEAVNDPVVGGVELVGDAVKILGVAGLVLVASEHGVGDVIGQLDDTGCPGIHRTAGCRRGGGSRPSGYPRSETPPTCSGESSRRRSCDGIGVVEVEQMHRDGGDLGWDNDGAAG